MTEKKIKNKSNKQNPSLHQPQHDATTLEEQIRYLLPEVLPPFDKVYNWGIYLWDVRLRAIKRLRRKQKDYHSQVSKN